MAESGNGDQTEKASAHKLRKAREEGHVPRSRDLGTAVGIFVCLQLILLLAPGYLSDLHQLFVKSFASPRGDGAFDDAFSQVWPATLILILKMLLPLLVVPFSVIVASMFPGGWSLNGAALFPRFERLSPGNFFGRVFKTKNLVDTSTAVFKALVFILVLYLTARASVLDYLRLQSLPLDQALRGAAALMRNGTMALCAVLIAFAFADLPIQVFVFLRGQRMSKSEMKEEHKTSEGRPEVRQRIRQLQNQIARRSVRKSVPTADVVIVNPEHYSIALKYDETRASAPFVVAKGIDEMAHFIREVAALHGVEIVALPPLARAIYNTSQINQQIPASLYTAVARVLSYVLQIRAFRAGQRSFEPESPNDLGVPDNLTMVTP